MKIRPFISVAVLAAISVLTLAYFLFPNGNNNQIQAQEISPTEIFIEAGGGEIESPKSVCLTDAKRSEIQKKLRENIEKLSAEGVLPPPDVLLKAQNQFIFPVRGNAAAANDFGVHGISNFVDHNPSFPNLLSDYSCGARTYDTTSGYNHKGIDIYSAPFSWRKMDNNEVAIIAAAAGVIIYKSDGNADRSCSFNNNNWNAVYLRHADGTVSWYGHMKLGSLTTKLVGDSVSQGEFLGIVGSSGNSSGPHLHFEIYNSSNQLQDPYQGACNTLNNFSYWINQPAYRDSKINKLMTHSAPPSFSTCPNPEVPNEKTAFQPGEQLIVAAYYRDQTTGQQSQLSLIQPNGSVFTNWSHNSPNNYNSSYWFWTLNLPGNAPQGVWRFRVSYESATYEQTFTVGSVARNKKTVGVFRPTNGITYLRNSNTGGFADVNMVYGVNGDTSVAGDWNGDGVDSLGIYRNGVFYLRNSNTTGPADVVFAFGSPGDQPVAGDWNGDGVDTIGVYRPTTGVFLLRNSNTAGAPDITFVLGNPGDVAIAGDWNGDGTTTTGVFRPTNGIVYLKNANTTGNADIYLVYGVAGDKPVAGDWDGDGADSIGIYRDGVFYLRNSNTQGVADIVFAFGNPGDEPIAGDWDGVP